MIGHSHAVCGQRKADEDNEVVERYGELAFYNTSRQRRRPSAPFLGVLYCDDADAWYVSVKLNA